MTQIKDDIQRVAEFNALFMNLNEKGQETALIILRSLGFAQSVMYSQEKDQRHNPSKQLV